MYIMVFWRLLNREGLDHYGEFESCLAVLNWFLGLMKVAFEQVITCS